MGRTMALIMGLIMDHHITDLPTIRITDPHTIHIGARRVIGTGISTIKATAEGARAVLVRAAAIQTRLSMFRDILSGIRDMIYPWYQ